MWKEEIEIPFIGFIIPVCLTSFSTWKPIQRGSKQIADLKSEYISFSTSKFLRSRKHVSSVSNSNIGCEDNRNNTSPNSTIRAQENFNEVKVKTMSMVQTVFGKIENVFYKLHNVCVQIITMSTRVFFKSQSFSCPGSSTPSLDRQSKSNFEVFF